MSKGYFLIFLWLLFDHLLCLKNVAEMVGESSLTTGFFKTMNEQTIKLLS